MKITLSIAGALLAVGLLGCASSSPRGGSKALDIERDWSAELNQGGHRPEVLRDWGAEAGRIAAEMEAQPDYRKVLASPGPF